MIKTKRVIAFILLITFLASLIFVGKVASTDAKKNSNTKKKITMTVGQKKTIKLNKNVKIKWKTSNKKVVSVSKKGVIKAKKVGKAKVTAKSPNKKVQYIVKVNKKSENITPPESNKIVGNYIKLFFNVNQKTISTATNTITGTLSFSGYESIVKILVNDKFVTQKEFTSNEVEFSIEVNLSKFQNGDKLTIRREYIGDSDQKYNIWDDQKEYTLYTVPETPAPTAGPKATPTPKVVADAWLLFGVDQQTITVDTKKITGKLSFNKYKSAIKVYVNNNLIAQKDFVNGQEEFSINVDFSYYNPGDNIVIFRQYIGDYIPNKGIWDQQKTYTLCTSSGIVPTPTPLPPNYDWYYEGEPHEKGVILLTLNEPTDAKTVCAMLNNVEIEDIEDIYKTFYDRFKDDYSANSDAVEIIKNNIGKQYTITLVDKSDDFLYKTIVSLNANPLVKYAGVNHIVGPAVIW